MSEVISTVEKQPEEHVNPIGPVEPPRPAPFPFNKATGDVVLRSSDNVDFRVRHAILAEASPVFEVMFSLPQPADVSALDPIALTEDSRTLETLLRICYPIADPIPTAILLSEVDAVLEAALKYDIDSAATLVKRLLIDRFVREDPIRVYCIACRHDLECEAKEAAKEALKQGVVELPGHAVTLQGISAGCYYRLLQYQQHADRPIEEFEFCRPAASDRTSSLDAQSSVNDIQTPASYPFDQNDSDMTITSSDHATFKLHSNIIRLASPVLSRMLDRAQRITDSDGCTKSSLAVSDSSKSLDLLLRTIYPCKQPDLEDSDIFLLAPLAHKYQMERVLQVVQEKCRTIAHSKPLEVYLLASQYDWKEEMEAAARKALSLNMWVLKEKYNAFMENISASVYIRLLDFHRSCGEAASTRVQSRLSSLQTTPPPEQALGGDATPVKKCNSKAWCPDGAITENIQNALRDRPCSDTITWGSTSFSEVIDGVFNECSKPCRSCNKRLRKTMNYWRRQIVPSVNHDVSAVRNV